jgi:hypothetical protein
MWDTYQRALSREMNHHKDYIEALEAHGVFTNASPMFSIGPGAGVFEKAWLDRGEKQLGYVEPFNPQRRTLGLY